MRTRLSAVLLVVAATFCDGVAAMAQHQVGVAKWPEFQATGDGPGSDGKMVGGLGFTVVLREGKQALESPKLWKIPCIPVSSQYWEPRDIDPGPRLPLDLGTISCGEKCDAKNLDRDWAHAGLQICPSLALYVTRLSPALVFDCAAPQLTLFGGGKTTPIAYATPKGVFPLENEDKGGRTRDQQGPSSHPSSFILHPSARDWLLLWFGKDAGLQSTRFPWAAGGPNGRFMFSAADCPMLVLFQRPPAAMTAQHGATFQAAGRGSIGKVALLPLYGDLYPLAAETAAWAKDGKLPPAVAAACQWWSDHLAEVPMTARERYAYDVESDTVAIASETTYLKIHDGGKRFAPLPPMMALALEQGFPLRLSGTVVRTSVTTAVGPYAGIEGTGKYECRVTGLGNYVRETPAVADVAKEPAELRGLLRDEIAKMLKAGHLAPWMPAPSAYAGMGMIGFGQTLDFSAPGQTLAILAQALPLLDKDQQAEVKAYLKRERDAYPPESVGMMPLDVGVRRERWRLDVGHPPQGWGKRDWFSHCQAEYNRLNFYAKRRMARAEALYDLSLYARSVEPMTPDQIHSALRQVLSPYFLHQDWASLGCYLWSTSYWGEVYGQGGELDANNMFAGLIGALRLAEPGQGRRKPAALVGTTGAGGDMPLRHGPLRRLSGQGQGHFPADGPGSDQGAMGSRPAVRRPDWRGSTSAWWICMDTRTGTCGT